MVYHTARVRKPTEKAAARMDLEGEATIAEVQQEALAGLIATGDIADSVTFKRGSPEGKRFKALFATLPADIQRTITLTQFTSQFPDMIKYKKNSMRGLLNELKKKANSRAAVEQQRPGGAGGGAVAVAAAPAPARAPATVKKPVSTAEFLKTYHPIIPKYKPIKRTAETDRKWDAFIGKWRRCDVQSPVLTLSHATYHRQQGHE